MKNTLKVAGVVVIGFLLAYPGGTRELIWDTQHCVQQLGCEFWGGELNMNDAADALGEATGNHRWQQ